MDGNVKIIWKALIVLGACLAAFAINMDTTVQTGFGRVHNVGLQGQQVVVMMLGCALLLGGLILFAATKIRPGTTPQEDPKKVAREQAEIAADKQMQQELGRRLAGVREHMVYVAGDRFFFRLGTSCFVGLCTLAFMEPIHLTLLALFPFVYAFRRKPANHVLQHLWRFNFWLVIVGTAFYLAGPIFDLRGPFGGGEIPVTLIAAAVTLSVTLMGVFVTRRKKLQAEE
jgi:hypothetical protein